MSDTTPTSLPEVELATKEWVSREYIDTERRIEKAFHEQTRFFNEKFDNHIKWIIRFTATITFATIAAIMALLFK